MTDTIPKAKIMLREQIQADVDQYLAAGGRIQYIDHGDVNADPRQIGPLSDSAAWERRRGEFTIRSKGNG